MYIRGMMDWVKREKEDGKAREVSGRWLPNHVDERFVVFEQAGAGICLH